MEPPSPLPVVTREARERAIRTLCAHFTHDNLPTDEFERRLELAYKATAPAELALLTADLPTLPPEEHTAPEIVSATASTRATAPDASIRDTSAIIAVMGGTERRGHWTPARRNFVFAMMGGIELDFREARLGAGVTEVTIFAMMGGVSITVPPGLPVECHGMGIMGGFEHVGSEAPADPDAPRLRIEGLALMGGVDFNVRLPGETKSEARKRLAAERRRLRDEQRRLR